MFANPLGLLALLGLPIVLAIHFLQRKSITIPVSTLFLLERTQREATSGRRFERLLPSIPLWMQLLAVLLLAWFLAEPRFQKENSVQRVAIVLDTSASMSVFKGDAIATLRDKIPALQGSASSMEITLLPSTPGADRIYSGASTEEMLDALENFPLSAGLSDPSYALRLARSIVSKDGAVIYLTDTPKEHLPYESQLISVGKSTDNVGFTGISFEEKGGTLIWQALIRNYGDAPVTRSWSLVTSEGGTRPKEFEIAPKSFVTIQAAFPRTGTDVRVTLTEDDFPLDDTLPIIAPKPKELNLFTATSPAFRGLTERLLRSLQSTRPSNDAASSDLIISSYDPLDPSVPDTNSILFVEDPTSVGKYLKGGILAEADPLMDGINWQALLVRETLELPRLPEDRVLLWQEKRPLIFLREKSGNQTLCFNFDLRLSNATSQPAFIVLLHRFAESIRLRKIAPQALNLETGQAIRIATNPESPVIAIATDPSGKKIPSPPSGRAPQIPGFLTISQQEPSLLKLGAIVPASDEERPLLTAAVHFADTREADLTGCAPSDLQIISSGSTLKKHTSADPLARLWVLLLSIGLLIAWYFSSPKESPAPATS
ncbi:vWA domain-containing protein [Luteolibacter sp. AS25]|uniref:vWA domain-containing protein n=1 Tax=Luteolibacter sp. AS25 TaxID=3135776 RepID=UPI00398A8F9A